MATVYITNIIAQTVQYYATNNKSCIESKLYSVSQRESGTRLFGSANRHKVVLHTDKKRALGFSVRGGSEYGLGMYISV